MKGFIRNIRILTLLSVSILILSGIPTSAAAVPGDNRPHAAAAVLVGPCGLPGAMGPTSVDDDFTNRSLNTGLTNVAPGGVTKSAGTVVFRNTVQNLGAGDDVFMIGASAPAGFKIEISIDNGSNYFTVEPWSSGVTLAVAYRAAATFLVRVTAPAGLRAFTGFDTVVRVTSTMDPSATNDTIDRLYTGFIRIDRTATVVNATGHGGANDAVPGAEIEFAIAYANISSAVGDGSSLLTAEHLVISESGFAAPNNWGANTEHVVGASDTRGGIILGDAAGSTSLTDLVMTLEAGQSGVFKFRRRVK